MQISVFFYSILRDHIGKGRIYNIGNDANIRQLFKAIIKENGNIVKDFLYNSDGRLKGSLTILVNGSNIKQIKGLETLLNEGDVINILPPVGGG